MAVKPGKKPPKHVKPDMQDAIVAMLGSGAPASEPEKPARNPVGRPPKYRSEMCAQVIEWGKQGKSKTWMAAHLGVNKVTLHEWINSIPEFSNAMDLAEYYSQVWWEDAGQNGMLMPGFNASIWSRSMSARFPKEWRETKNAEITGADGGAIKLDVQRIDVNNLPGRVLDALEQALEMIENPEEDEGEIIEGEAEDDSEE